MTGLPKIVMQRLRQKAAPGGHVDVDQLTAFAENGLGERERMLVVTHLADCTDCREILWLAAPEQVATLPVPQASGSSWLAWPVLRWGAAAACVVVVAAVGLLYRSQPEKSAAQFAVKQETDRRDTVSAALQAPRAQDEKPMPSSAVAPDKKSTGDFAKLEQTPSSPPALSVGAIAENKVAEKTEAVAKKMDQPKSSQTVEVTAASAAVQNVPTENEIAQMVPGRAKDALQERDQAMADAVSAPMAKMRMSPLATPHPPLPLAEGLVPRWTLSADGSVQRSLDSGRSWETIPFSRPATFRALAANGLEIWVGGAKGVLYHSSDAGQRWNLIQPVVSGQPLTSDIVRIEFTDTLHGTLTTSDKQLWQTANNGASWQRQ